MFSYLVLIGMKIYYGNEKLNYKSQYLVAAKEDDGEIPSPNADQTKKIISIKDDTQNAHQVKQSKKEENNSIYYSRKPEESALVESKCNLTELNLLKTLSKRREQINNWDKEALNKENALKLAGELVEKKIIELQRLKEEVIKLTEEYKVKEGDKINTLVKIYETMKPKEAAKIFETLDMPILLQLMNKMKPTKVATVMGFIAPYRAKEISIEFTKQKELPNLSR
jgi:flagellar motility protein MotE (MotC chaperone)